MSTATTPDKTTTIIIPAVFAVVVVIAFLGFIFTLRRRFPSPTMALLNAARQFHDEEAGLHQNRGLNKPTLHLNDSGYLVRPKEAHLSSTLDMLYLPRGVAPLYTIHTQRTVEPVLVRSPSYINLPSYDPRPTSGSVYAGSPFPNRLNLNNAS